MGLDKSDLDTWGALLGTRESVVTGKVAGPVQGRSCILRRLIARIRHEVGVMLLRDRHG